MFLAHVRNIGRAKGIQYMYFSTLIYKIYKKMKTITKNKNPRKGVSQKDLQGSDMNKQNTKLGKASGKGVRIKSLNRGSENLELETI